MSDFTELTNQIHGLEDANGFEDMKQRIAELRQREVDALREADDMKQRIAELEQELKGPDNYETWKDAAIDERVKRVDAIKERDALLAHVERLRTSALNAICVMPSGEAKAELRDAYDEPTPTNSLNTVRREAYLQACKDIETAIIKFVSDTTETGQFDWSDCQWLEDWRDEWLEQNNLKE